MSTFEIRRLAGPAEEESYGTCIGAAFGTRISQDLINEDLTAVGRERVLGAFDAGEVVGTASWFQLELTLPGGGATAGAGVTAVTTLPSHRRRGVLTGLMRRQLDDLIGDGVPCALLTASEGGIYGRFGYGVATYKCRYRIDKRITRLREGPGDGAGDGRVRLVTCEDAAKLFPDVWEQARSLRPGEVSYPAEFWVQHFRAQPPWREIDQSKRFFAVYEERGQVLGCADYQVAGGQERSVDLDLFFALNRRAYVALWRYLIGIDLVWTIATRQRPVDEPLRRLLTDPRRLEMSDYQDGLWVRPLDVAALLQARRYAPGGARVISLEVRDQLFPQLAGAYTLEVDASGAGAVTRSEAGTSVDLVLDVAEVGSALLGGVSFASLRAGGLLFENTPGAAWRADSIFACDVSPFLTLGF